ncbi:hypothetical protein M758_5G089400 [Ceratodon purpureus]|nr:hypothetical protein M758_5G089400 [Ceratodon purpureus]
MAMAVDGSHTHSSMTLGSSQASENAWSSTAWEQQSGLADSLSMSMEGSGGGEYGGRARMEWELKANSWEWENLTMVYPRQGEGQQRLPSAEWGSAGCSAVTLATSAGGGSGTDDVSIGLASGSSTPSGTSVSSGIPGVGAGRGSSSSGGEPGALVKSELDEQTAMGTPATLGNGTNGLFFNLGGGRSRGSAEASPERDESGRRSGGQSNGSSVVSGGGDSLNIGLKLGRRTYFKDCAAGGQGQAKSGSPAGSAGSPPAKKPRVMSTSTQVARCQVEGCKADLSGSKDYHKRHKVCEMHSKAPKAIAGGIEQRFCQQCSRFHVLSEFDEGKRSCRRRLAGHNERRRKPHPETHSVFGLRNSSSLYGDTSRLGFDSAPFYFLDSKRPSYLQRHRGSSLDDELSAYSDVKRTSPWSTSMRRDDSNLAYQLQAASTERQSIFSTISRPTADRLLMLLQNPKTQMPAPSTSTGMNLGGHQYPEGPLGPLGQGLSLSSSTGGVVGSLEQSRLGSCSQALSSVSGMMDSGRALSLLSSQSWASRPLPGAPPPVSVGLSKAADSTLEQLVASSNDSSSRGSRFANQVQLPALGGSSTTSAQQQFDAQFSVQSGAGLDSVALNCGLTATGNGTHQRQGCGNGNVLGGLGRYEEPNSIQEQLEALRSGFGGSHEGRPTIDLMQMPAVGAHHVSHGTQSNGVHSGQYGGFSSLRPFESSIFTSQ